MNCPKCNGETYLSDEDFAAVAEKTQPPKVIVKETYVCKSCYEKFTRVMVHNLDAKTTGMAGTGTVNKILGELNFPEQSTQVDSDIFRELSTIDPMSNDTSSSDSTETKTERPKFTDI